MLSGNIIYSTPNNTVIMKWRATLRCMNGLHIKVSINTIHLIYEGSSNLEYVPNMCIGPAQTDIYVALTI